MQTTGNLGLKKPDGTDIVDIADLNGNMDILDTAVKAVQDHAADTVKHITAAERTAWNAKASTAVATTTTAGLESAADKAKLDGIAAGANNYTHPTGDGNLHVPATGTGNSTKVLKAGATAGSAAWGAVNGSEVVEDSAHRFATDTEKATWNAKASTAAATTTTAGLESAADKTKLDGIATGANVVANSASNGVITINGTNATVYTHPNHTGDVTSTGDGVTAIAPGVIVNADVNATAAIDATKIGTGVVSNAEFGYLDGVTSGIQGQLNGKSPTVDYVRQPAYSITAGTGAAYTVNLTPAPASLPEGFGITIVPNLVNTAGPTLNVNGLGAIPLKDQKGIAYATGKLLAGKPYMFRKVGTDFLADSAGGSGTAVAGDIRAGKTAATDAGDVTGSLTVQTGGTVTPGPSAIVKAAGIYDTAITVAAVAVPAAALLVGNTVAGTAGTMPITNPDYSDQLTAINSSYGPYSGNGLPYIYLGMTSNRYYSGVSWLRIHEAGLIPSNVRSGITAFGGQLVGSLLPQQYASGAGYTSSNILTVNGLSFTPKVIICRFVSGVYNVTHGYFNGIWFLVLNFISNGYQDNVTVDASSGSSIQSNGFTMYAYRQPASGPIPWEAWG
ncbi:hypothetical protein [Paenibacillus sp. FSL R10-2771]|uniref:hypothetical protein n=1 Tax=Paenibacillus sp. FSL R10-2771 TaxID=2954693 RepID=UPI0030F525D9